MRFGSRVFVLLVFVLLVVGCFVGLGRGQVVGGGAIDDGLVGYWRLDDNGLDSSGNGYTAVITDSDYVAGKYLDAVNCTHADSKITVDGFPAFSAGSNFTLSAWVKINGWSLNYNCLFDRNIYTERALLYNGNLLLQFGSGTNYYSSSDIKLNTFFLLTLVFNGTDENVFVNGAFIGNTTNYDASFSYGSIITFGYLDGVNYPFNGIIDDVRIYDRALSRSEVASLMDIYSVVVTYDIGSTVSPNGTILCGLDQPLTLSCGVVSTNFMQSSLYVDNVPIAPVVSYSFGGVQANHSLYVTSEFVGGGSSLTVESGFDWGSVVVLVSSMAVCLVVMGWFTRVRFFGVVVGLVAFVVGVYVGVNAWSVSVVAGWFSVFEVVVSLLTVLFCGLGVRVRGKR